VRPRADRFTMDDVRRFWDGAAEDYARENERIGWIHTQRFKEGLKGLSLKPGMRVLNVWSRVGGAIPHVRRACDDLRLINAELSFAMLKCSRAQFPGEAFVQSALHELPFADASFNAVLSLETLEHVPSPRTFLKEVRRVIVEGGTLVMSLPPSLAEWTSALNKLFGFHHGEGPHRFISPREVKALLANCGFHLTSHRGTLFVPIKGALFETVDAKLSTVFGDGPLAQCGLRQFYVCEASR
jgi:ubiquinone/menaquinone biosynthesis C-methylase UbiE